MHKSHLRTDKGSVDESSFSTSSGILLGGRGLHACLGAGFTEDSRVQMARAPRIVKALYLLCQLPVLTAPLQHRAQSDLN